MSQANGLTEKEFWELKHKIDDEVARLGWNKAFCKRYIITHYGKISRHAMTDEQLKDMLNTLESLPTPKFNRNLVRRRCRRRNRRGIRKVLDKVLDV